MKSLLKRVSSPDPDLINAYAGKVPHDVKFSSELDVDGEWVIQIIEIDGKELGKKTLLMSQTKKKEDILHQVHDVVMTYCGIPENLRSYYERGLSISGEIKARSGQLAGA